MPDPIRHPAIVWGQVLAGTTNTSFFLRKQYQKGGHPSGGSKKEVAL
jgi:hypothetical protein